MVESNESESEHVMDYNRPIEIAEGIFWVGFVDMHYKLHCNPYLIIDGDEAVVIDGGSRPDFSTVMLKILQTGIKPEKIKRLIYHHYDPDLCGSIHNLEDIIDSPKLKIISHKENNVFIKYYAAKSPFMCVEEMGFSWSFSSGRRLTFIPTPYAHSPGSFVTYDTKTGTLFSSDIFGSFDERWQLYLQIAEQCLSCTENHENVSKNCIRLNAYCPLHGIYEFHKKIMTSTKALKKALNAMKSLDIKIIAPQHGSLIKDSQNIIFIMNKLEGLERVGIDGYVQE